MKYHREIVLKDGRACTLRNGTAQDGQAALDCFVLTHAQTDELRTYPDEMTDTAEEEGQFLQKQAESDRAVELVAVVDGRVVGLAGFESVGDVDKTRHRAEFGISIDQEFWGQGIGRAMTKACIELARDAGYAQLELDVVGDNVRALALYESEGFIEYGRNPRGFRSRLNGWQELVLMRMEL